MLKRMVTKLLLCTQNSCLKKCRVGVLFTSLANSVCTGCSLAARL